MNDHRSAIEAYVRSQANPVDKFSHQPRLYALTQQVGRGLDYDDDVVFAAAWLHDIGVFIGHRPEDPEALAQWDMLAYALKVVPGVLDAVGFPAHKKHAVLEAIRTHQPSGNPESVEAVILRDADILEQLGAAGIARAVCKIGRDTRFRTFNDALKVLRHNLDTLPQQLKLEQAQRMASKRVQVLKTFLQQASDEGLE